jgi:hypothetical protein
MSETIARRELQNYNSSLITEQPQAVPIEDIVECHYGLELEYRHLRKNGVILGCTVFNDTMLPIWLPEERRYTIIPIKGGTIVIDASLLVGNEGRLRFTIAHELAHWLIHKELYTNVGKAAAHAVKLSLEENPQIERQANMLATSLLMPKNQVKKAFFKVRNCTNAVAELAELFGVSKQAMAIFLKDHNMV